MNKWEERDLFERLGRMERLAQKAVLLAGGGASSYPTYALVSGGQVINATYSIDGLKRSGTAITAVPAASPSAGTYSAGIGYGNIYTTDGTGILTNKWLIYDSTSAMSSKNIIESNFCFVVTIGTLPITGGGGSTAPVYYVTSL